MLSGDIDDGSHKISQSGEALERTADKYFSATFSGDGTSDDEFVIIEIDADGFEHSHGRGMSSIDGKESFDAGLIGACSDDVDGSFSAEEESEGADDDGFTGASFAGEDGESVVEGEFEFGDDSKVFDNECRQHAVLLYWKRSVTRNGRSAPYHNLCRFIKLLHGRGKGAGSVL